VPAESVGRGLNGGSTPGTVGVYWIGAQRDVIAGDIRGHAALADLAATPHLYGLGPLEGLRGEVSIFGGLPSIARVDAGAVVTTETWDARACFLVWAQVMSWSERPIASALEGLGRVEDEAIALAREQGLDLERPFPFRIRGSAAAATLHVLDKRDGLPHNADRHEQAKVRQTLKRTAVELIGFHSRRHRGVFTPRDADVHVHLRTGDGRVSGHLEDIRLGPGAGVAVPAAGWTR
jgi:acetolactate decarboxylase